MTEMTQSTFTPPESFARLEELRAKRQRLIEAAEGTPAQIDALGKEVEALREEATARQVAFLAEVATAKLKQAHDAQMATLTQRELELEAQLRRLRSNLPALESEIASVEKEMNAAELEVRLDAARIGCDIGDPFIAEILRLAEAMRPWLAKVKAVQDATGACLMGQVYVPQPHFVSRYVGYGEYSRASNVLGKECPEANEQAAEVRALLEPVQRALAMATGCNPYIPLDERPKPYVRKGQTVTWSGGAPPLGGSSSSVIRR
ncbi:hypothetical protein [Cupriavidus sp. AcVe19-6a]|uniref:hypothetical protein n=1 Tax=Cupriavidus sp. AcVe19-6a TaxID=2821358 RepID=UPI001AEA86A3|nr:hypothetical protein [Cupriavidus sp. AcVe19-6a]MBP0639570.1 hypothetical protein [Cupriavidus sp. AcVe19-6a]